MFQCLCNYISVITDQWFNKPDHVFLPNIIAYCQQDRYVRLVIYTDWFILRTLPNGKVVKKWYDWYNQCWLKFGVASRESFLGLNITSLWIHFQLGPNAPMFKVFTFEAILFTFSCISFGEKTRKFFPVKPFFWMSSMKGLSKCPYSKEPVLPCAPITLILTFVPISGFL